MYITEKKFTEKKNNNLVKPREKISTGLASHGHPLNCHAGPWTKTATTRSLKNRNKHGRVGEEDKTKVVFKYELKYKYLTKNSLLVHFLILRIALTCNVLQL